MLQRNTANIIGTLNQVSGCSREYYLFKLQTKSKEQQKSWFIKYGYVIVIHHILALIIPLAPVAPLPQVRPQY